MFKKICNLPNAIAIYFESLILTLGVVYLNCWRELIADTTQHYTYGVISLAQCPVGG